MPNLAKCEITKNEAHHYTRKQVAMHPERFRTFKMVLPVGVYDGLQAAERKIVRVLGLDAISPEKRASRQICAWEAIASLINGTDESRLKMEIEGEE